MSDRMFRGVGAEEGDEWPEGSIETGEVLVRLDFDAGVEYDIDDHGDGELVIQYWRERDQ